MKGKYVEFESTITKNENYDQIIDDIRKERKYIVDTIRSFIKIELLDTTGDNIFSGDNIFLDIENIWGDWINFVYYQWEDSISVRDRKIELEEAQIHSNI